MHLGTFAQNTLEKSAYRPLGPRSVTKERAPTERNSSWQKSTGQNVIMLHDIQYMCMRVFISKLLPCCDHSCRTRCPADRSGTPQGISASLKADEGLFFSTTFSTCNSLESDDATCKLMWFALNCMDFRKLPLWAIVLLCRADLLEAVIVLERLVQNRYCLYYERIWFVWYHFAGGPSGSFSPV